MEQDVRELVSKVIGIDLEAVHLDLTPRDVAEWDSATHMMLLMAAEETFDVTLSDDDMISVGSVGDLLTIVSRLKS